MKKIKFALIALAIMVGVTGLVLAPDTALAQVSDIQKGVDAVGGGGAPTLGSQLKNVINVLMFILGAIAVIMIVIGGIRYATSNGDSGSTKSAKDTVLYAVIGLIVALMAYAIVNFVLDSF
jgi:hypothetical protein